jgi:hypothetical protein
LSLLS